MNKMGDDRVPGPGVNIPFALFLSLILVQCTLSHAHAEPDRAGQYEVVVGSHTFDLNKLIKDDELEYLEREELSILRNALFAKHGYRFRTAKFREIFSAYDWYQPEHDDVSGMLTWIDLKNIELIQRYEIGVTVHTIEQATSPPGGTIRIEFYLRGNPSYSDCSFTRFKIFEVIDGRKNKVFDSNTIDDELCVFVDSMEQAVVIEDRNGDGSKEFYFDVSDPISPIVLVVGKVGGEYCALYHEPTFNVSYRDVDGDGIPELLSDHLGGGGFVSWWQGLLLVNVMEDTIYAFSYELTRSYYEERLRDAETAFSETGDVKHFAWLLNANADLGNFDACSTLVYENEDLASLEREEYEPYINGPDEDLISFTLMRAAEYERIWEQLKKRKEEQ